MRRLIIGFIVACLVVFMGTVTRPASYGWRLEQALREHNPQATEATIARALVAFEDATDRLNLDKRLVYNMIRRESGFRIIVWAVSTRPNGDKQIDRGLMGLCPAVADWGAWKLKFPGMYQDGKLIVAKIYDPAFNITTGCAWLAYCYGVANDDTQEALIAYNAGPTTLKSYRAASRYAREVMTYAGD